MWIWSEGLGGKRSQDRQERFDAASHSIFQAGIKLTVAALPCPCGSHPKPHCHMLPAATQLEESTLFNHLRTLGAGVGTGTTAGAAGASSLAAGAAGAGLGGSALGASGLGSSGLGASTLAASTLAGSVAFFSSGAGAAGAGATGAGLGVTCTAAGGATGAGGGGAGLGTAGAGCTACGAAPKGTGPLDRSSSTAGSDCRQASEGNGRRRVRQRQEPLHWAGTVEQSNILV